MTFHAKNGAVTVNGRAISELRAVALRQRLVVLALHLNAKPAVAEKAWDFANQLRAALTDARDQRRAAQTSAAEQQEGIAA